MYYQQVRFIKKISFRLFKILNFDRKSNRVLFYFDFLADARAKVFTEEELKSATDVYTGKIERKDSLVSDEKFDTILNSLNMLAVKIERDFKEENSMTDFAKERIKSKDTQKCPNPIKSM